MSAISSAKKPTDGLGVSSRIKDASVCIPFPQFLLKELIEPIPFLILKTVHLLDLLPLSTMRDYPQRWGIPRHL